MADVISNSNLRYRLGTRVTWVGFCANLILTSFKLFAGIWGRSQAMTADAIHSLSDFATDIVVLIGFKVVSKPADMDHTFGHGR
ncbi:MAG TPA: cation-efflux pump, partial [bacterium (Candidatus Stahlbacteria)]|nr:cation-efflux pump [Candidatus Stahlbacteria bacterium]